MKETNLTCHIIVPNELGNVELLTVRLGLQ